MEVDNFSHVPSVHRTCFIPRLVRLQEPGAIPFSLAPSDRPILSSISPSFQKGLTPSHVLTRKSYFEPAGTCFGPVSPPRTSSRRKSCANAPATAMGVKRAAYCERIHYWLHWSDDAHHQPFHGVLSCVSTRCVQRR